jgi:hypothetical protein
MDRLDPNLLKLADQLSGRCGSSDDGRNRMLQRLLGGIIDDSNLVEVRHNVTTLSEEKQTWTVGAPQ